MTTERERQHRRFLEARARLSRGLPKPPPPPIPMPTAAPPAAPALVASATIDEVMSLVAELHGRANAIFVVRSFARAMQQSEDVMLAESRRREVVHLRATLAWVIHQICPNAPKCEIGRAVRRDHSVILHYQKLWPHGPPDVALAFNILAATRRRLDAERTKIAEPGSGLRSG